MTVKSLAGILSLILLSLINAQLLFAEEIQITIKGMNDGVRTTRQHDYKEAVLDAKIKAIEQAGVEIKSLTVIKDFKLREDNVEAKSEGLLLPGYQIIDIGYTTDGTYQIVLSGKLRVKTSEPKESGALRYVVSMIKRGQNYTSVREELDKIMQGNDSESSAGALYYLSVMEFYYNKYDRHETIIKKAYENLEKMRSYYPDSLWVGKLERALEKQSIYHKFKSYAIAKTYGTTELNSNEAYGRDTYSNDNFKLTIENNEHIANIKYGELKKEGNLIQKNRKDRLPPFFGKQYIGWHVMAKNAL